MTAIIQTRTGKLLDVLDPSPSDITIYDIGSALAKTNRFGGHTFEPYSVAQHCVVMADQVPEEDRLWALMHDATEAYIGDLPKPIKNVMPQFDALEVALMGQIARRFGLSLPMPKSVKDADVRMMLTEARDLMYEIGAFESWNEGMEPYRFTITPWHWIDAQDAWIHAVQGELNKVGY